MLSLSFRKSAQPVTTPEQTCYKSMYATTLKVTADLSKVTGSDVKGATSQPVSTHVDGSSDFLLLQNRTSSLCQLLKDLSHTCKELKPT